MDKLHKIPLVQRRLRQATVLFGVTAIALTACNRSNNTALECNQVVSSANNQSSNQSNATYKINFAQIVSSRTGVNPPQSATRQPNQSQTSPAKSRSQPKLVRPNQPNYEWRNVAISGMGFVTGIVIHPKEPNLIYLRTDVGGIYRWQPNESSWVQLLDGFIRYQSIESIALDPNNPNLLYAATGSGEVLKSRDRGQTWITSPLRTKAGQAVRMNGNGEWRWVGERLAVDPNNSTILYFGSRMDGLYRSTNGGQSWQPVSNFPTVGAQGGIAFVVFGQNSQRVHQNINQTMPSIYVGVMGEGVYQSENGGKQWVLLTGGPSQDNPQQGQVAADGSLYVSSFTTLSNPKGKVWKYAVGVWTDITPEPDENYSALAVDPRKPNTVMVATYPLKPEGLYRTTNGGKDWQRQELVVQTISWWPNWHLFTLPGGLVIDPHVPKRVWLTTGFGVLRTDNIKAHPSRWCSPMRHLEEFIVLVVKSPPVENGARLFSGVADMDGFRHDSLSVIPDQTYDIGKFGDTTGIDFSEANPNVIVRVGSFPGKQGREDAQGRAAYSSDNGRTWQPFKYMPEGAANGKVAVSATLQANGKPIIVWAPQGDMYPQRSLDGGKTWLPVEGAPNRTTLQVWFPSQAIASDRVDGNLFYLYKYNERPNQGMVYRSSNGGATWSRTVTGLPDHWLHTIKAVPGMRGHVWLSVKGHPLYRSSDAGISFTPLANVQAAHEFSFGKPAPGQKYPTLFVYGTVNHRKGLFRSDNATNLAGNAEGAKWVKIANELGNVTFLEGDRRTFGMIYVGTGGRGIFYGQPRGSSN